MQIRRGAVALTLGEVVISTALLALLIVTTVQLLTQLLASNTKNRAQISALNFALRRLEDIAENHLIDPGFTVEQAYLTDSLSATEYFLRVRRDPVSGRPDELSAGYLGGYSFTAECWWNNDSPERARPGVGLQKVSVTRFFYPRVIVP